MKFITPQMFDIRPRTSSGELDSSVTRRIKNTLDLSRGNRTDEPSLSSESFIASVEEEIAAYSKISIPIRRSGRLAPRNGLDVRVIATPPAQLPEILTQETQGADFPTIETEDIRYEVQPNLVSTYDSRELPPPATLPIDEPWQDSYIDSKGESSDAWEPILGPFTEHSKPFARLRTKRRFSFAYPVSFVFTVLAAILLVPALAFWGSARALEASLLSSVSEAAEQLEVATRSIATFNTEVSGNQFAEASKTFQEASSKLSDIGFGLLSLLAEVPLSSKLTSGKAILNAGEHLASAGREMSFAVSALEQLKPEEFLTDVLAPKAEAAVTSVQGKGASFEDALIKTAFHLEAAADALDKVVLDAVPNAYLERMTQIKAGIPIIRASVDAIYENARSLAGMFGMRDVRRYLILIQNSSELRPTGGFVGNVALLTIANGRLSALRIEDTYLFDGQIIKYTVPPKPIQDVSSAWSLHDSNWYRDFPTSAKIAADFFEVSGEATVDGVFAISSPVLERTLAVLGPISTEEGTVFDSNTVVDTLNALGAAQRPGETTQIRAMADFIPLLLERISSAEGEQKKQLRGVLTGAIASGDIQAWFRNEDEERIAKNIGVSGAIPETDGDFLAVVHSNINGFKSERVISEQVLHEVTVEQDGTMIVDVTLTRQHHGDKATYDFYKEVSKSYTRLLVPEGSQLLEVSGIACKPEDNPVRALNYDELGYLVSSPVLASESSFKPFSKEPCVEIGRESGKTVFATWLFTSPGETSTTKFRYRLPGRMSGGAESYGLTVLKQPGFTSSFESRVSAKSSWKIVWSDDGYQRVSAKELLAPALPLKKSRFFGVVLTKQP